MPKMIKYEGVDIDLEKVDRILRKIIIKENLNQKTKEKSDILMVQWIKKQIEEEIECY